MDLVLKIWQRLQQVSNLTFVAVSGRGDKGWNGKGSGDIQIEASGLVLIFREEGTWKTKEGQVLTFKNVWRWTYQPSKKSIKLEHLRFGAENPVFLFDLSVAVGPQLNSDQPHKCVNDYYTGTLTLKEDNLELDWYIEGPKKDEHIHYIYS